MGGKLLILKLKSFFNQNQEVLCRFQLILRHFLGSNVEINVIRRLPVDAGLAQLFSRSLANDSRLDKVLIKQGYNSAVFLLSNCINASKALAAANMA